MLLSPLITRGAVTMLCSWAPDADDLSDYAFLYGMVPTGPIVMLFAADYGLRTEMMASTMVICTALFGPLMFILARMLSLKVRGMEEFTEELRTTMLILSIISILSCVWIGLCLAKAKKYEGHLYKITASLMLSQIIMSTGVFMWSSFESNMTWVAFSVVAFVASGQLMSRLWVALLALYLAIKQRNALSPFIQHLSWPMSFGFGIPAAAVLMLLVMTTMGKCQPELHKELPLFIYGYSEAVASTIILSLCLFVTTFSLVLYYRSLSQSPTYEKEVPELKTSTSDVKLPDKKSVISDECSTGSELAIYKMRKVEKNFDVTDQKGIVKVQHLEDSKNTREKDGANMASSQSSLDIVSITTSIEAANSSDLSEYDGEETAEKGPRHLRHVILLILCSISMAVGLTISSWKLSATQTNGIFVAMEFLDAVLNVGQGIFILIVFWKESKNILEPLGKWLRKVRKGFYSFETDDMEDDVTQLCRQFRKYHWDNGMRDLPRNFSTDEQSYSQCFTGKELVNWLIEVGLASHSTAAEIYGQQLMRGGLLQSANGAVQFHDSRAYFYRLRDP